MRDPRTNEFMLSIIEHMRLDEPEALEASWEEEETLIDLDNYACELVQELTAEDLLETTLVEDRGILAYARVRSMIEDPPTVPARPAPLFRERSE